MTLGIGAALLLLAFVLQMTVVLPTIRWVEWTRAWETVAAFGSSVCWMVPVIWGTSAILRNSPPVHLKVPKVLFWILLANLLAFLALKGMGWAWWYYAEDPGGFMPNRIVWASFSAICLPILLEWRPWAWIPAAFGILFGASSCAYLALAMGALWRIRNERKAAALFALAVLLLAVIRILLIPLGKFVSWNGLIRIHTWIAVVKVILTHPFGIGFAIEPYREALKSSPWPILPHPASELLRLCLIFGWWIIPLIVWTVRRGMVRLKEDGLSCALVVAFALGCVQSSINVPHLGILVWALWMAWRIREAETFP